VIEVEGREAKIAIVHDYLNQRGGAERVVASLHRIFPEAPIFTSFVDPESLWPGLRDADIRTTWMQGLPGIRRHFKKYLPMYARAFESIDLTGFDVVLSSSSAFAKGVLKPEGALHVCYCYTPMRFVWDYDRYVEREGFGPLTRKTLPFLISRLKQWDLKTRDRPDCYIAISGVVRERIREYYGRDAEVIFPPVDVSRFAPSGDVEEFYLVVSRLNPYKRIDLAVETFNDLGLPLKIIGEGPDRNALEEMAGPGVEFLGRLDDEAVAGYYSRCRALIFPGIEDFGIVPLEANAAGRPVIAYRAGGALDTVVEGVTGVFFDEPAPAALAAAVELVESSLERFDPEAIRAHALGFDECVFTEKIVAFIAGKLADLRAGSARAESGVEGRRG